MLRAHMSAALFILLAVFAVFAVVVLYTVVLHPKNPPLRGETLTLGGRIFSVEVADTMLARARGLSGREGLLEGAGMLFRFERAASYGFWMKDMQFPIDIVWIRKGIVIGVSENLPPATSVTSMPVYYPPEHVDSVLEVNAGIVAELGVRPGDRIQTEVFGDTGSGASCRIGYCEPEKPSS